MAYRSTHPTLTANTVATVTLGSNWTHVEVTNWGTANRIFFTTDGSTPTVGGDETYSVGPNGGRAVADTPSPTATVVKLKCTTANDYSVVGF